MINYILCIVSNVNLKNKIQVIVFCIELLIARGKRSNTSSKTLFEI